MCYRDLTESLEVLLPHPSHSASEFHSPGVFIPTEFQGPLPNVKGDLSTRQRLSKNKEKLKALLHENDYFNVLCKFCVSYRV